MMHWTRIFVSALIIRSGSAAVLRSSSATTLDFSIGSTATISTEVLASQTRTGTIGDVITSGASPSIPQSSEESETSTSPNTMITPTPMLQLGENGDGPNCNGCQIQISDVLVDWQYVGTIQANETAAFSSSVKASLKSRFTIKYAITELPTTRITFNDSYTATLTCCETYSFESAYFRYYYDVNIATSTDTREGECTPTSPYYIAPTDAVVLTRLTDSAQIHTGTEDVPRYLSIPSNTCATFMGGDDSPQFEMGPVKTKTIVAQLIKTPGAPILLAAEGNARPTTVPDPIFAIVPQIISGPSPAPVAGGQNDPGVPQSPAPQPLNQAPSIGGGDANEGNSGGETGNGGAKNGVGKPSVGNTGGVHNGGGNTGGSDAGVGNSSHGDPINHPAAAQGSVGSTAHPASQQQSSGGGSNQGAQPTQSLSNTQGQNQGQIDHSQATPAGPDSGEPSEGIPINGGSSGQSGSGGSGAQPNPSSPGTGISGQDNGAEGQIASHLSSSGNYQAGAPGSGNGNTGSNSASGAYPNQQHSSGSSQEKPFAGDPASDPNSYNMSSSILLPFRSSAPRRDRGFHKLSCFLFPVMVTLAIT